MNSIRFVPSLGSIAISYYLLDIVFIINRIFHYTSIVFEQKSNSIIIRNHLNEMSVYGLAAAIIYLFFCYGIHILLDVSFCSK